MSDPWMVGATILASLVGGGITAATAWLLERQRARTSETRLRELFVAAVLDDLTYSVSIYDKIVEDHEKGRIVWHSTLIEFDQSRAIYRANFQSLLLLEDSELRRRIFRYYLKSDEVINALRSCQQQLDDYNVRIAELMARLESERPELSESERQTEAARLMEGDRPRADFSKQMIQRELGKLANFKFEAMTLASELKRCPQ